MNGNIANEPTAQPRAYDAALNGFSPDELSIRLLTELNADKSVLARRAFFDGGDVLVCAGGLFRFGFGADGGSVTLAPGEILVVYPGNVVTVESLKPKGRLRYVILNGTRVEDFFDAFGFYDRLKFQADTQYDTFLSAAAQFEAGNPRGALSLVRDALRTFGAELRQGKRAVLFDAITIIHRNLAQGVVRLSPVLDELHVSRATLHRAFTGYGLPGPGEFLRHAQFRKARRLLTTTALPIGEVAKSVGIPSPVYFTEFVRRLSGTTPTALRRRGI